MNTNPENAYVQAFDQAWHNLEKVCEEMKDSPFCKNRLLIRPRRSKYKTRVK